MLASTKNTNNFDSSQIVGVLGGTAHFPEHLNVPCLEKGNRFCLAVSANFLQFSYNAGGRKGDFVEPDAGGVVNGGNNGGS